jgi:hypothetical protein
MTKVLVEAGASLTAVDNKVIKPSVKPIQLSSSHKKSFFVTNLLKINIF